MYFLKILPKSHEVRISISEAHGSQQNKTKKQEEIHSQTLPQSGMVFKNPARYTVALQEPDYMSLDGAARLFNTTKINFSIT